MKCTHPLSREGNGASESFRYPHSPFFSHPPVVGWSFVLSAFCRTDNFGWLVSVTDYLCFALSSMICLLSCFALLLILLFFYFSTHTKVLPLLPKPCAVPSTPTSLRMRAGSLLCRLGNLFCFDALCFAHLSWQQQQQQRSLESVNRRSYSQNVCTFFFPWKICAYFEVCLFVFFFFLC